MRFKSILLTIIFLAVPFFALADDSLELQKKIMFDQKRLIVMKNMNLTETEAKAF